MKFPLKIIAVNKEIFIGQAVSLLVPSITGQIQVLPNHSPLVSLLKEGDVVIEKEDGEKENIPISGGTLEVAENGVVVLVNF